MKKIILLSLLIGSQIMSIPNAVEIDMLRKHIHKHKKTLYISLVVSGLVGMVGVYSGYKIYKASLCEMRLVPESITEKKPRMTRWHGPRSLIGSAMITLGSFIFGLDCLKELNYIQRCEKALQQIR